MSELKLRPLNLLTDESTLKRQSFSFFGWLRLVCNPALSFRCGPDRCAQQDQMLSSEPSLLLRLEILIPKMFGSDRIHPTDYQRAVVVDGRGEKKKRKTPP